MVESFQFDVDSRTWSPADPSSSKFDVLAQAKENQLLPWKDVFNLSHSAFFRIDPTREIHVPVAWHLGLAHVVDARNMFYAQAAGACHYLYSAEDGKHREALLGYLESYYTNGGKEELDVEKVFGMSDEELGKRVKAHAEAIGRGERD